MSTVDQIQRLCEEYVGRRFGKRDKRDLSEFLRSLQGQRTGDSDEEIEQQQYQSPHPGEQRSPLAKKEPEQLSMVKLDSAISKKATKFIEVVADTYKSSERGGVVKTSDFDVEEIAIRKAKWEEGQTIGAEGIKQPVEGYKLDETEEVRQRKAKWEEGQTIGAEGIRQPVEGYKLDETEEVRQRKAKWEEGQTIGAEGIKQPVEGYKLDETEEVRQRKAKWEQGQVIGAEGVRLTGSDVPPASNIKDRLNNYSQAAQATISPAADRKTPINLTPTDDVNSVSDVRTRLNTWQEVTKEPERPAVRKEPIKIDEE